MSTSTVDVARIKDLMARVEALEKLVMAGICNSPSLVLIQTRVEELESVIADLHALVSPTKRPVGRPPGARKNEGARN